MPSSPSAARPDDPRPTLHELLAAAVAGVGGSERPGQVTMAEAVATAMRDGEHLLVQAGTGTGKSLAYLVPALMHRDESPRADGAVVVATATIALQNQIVERDLPQLIDAVEPLLGRRPTYAILKGRSNYLCKNKVLGGMPDDSEDALFDASPTTALGRDVVRLRGWADDTETGDRDELDPGVGDRAWRQVSVSGRECLGAAKCPHGGECFAEQARDRAGEAEIVVTNHALLAIDALEDFVVLPEHDVVVVDEAHELVDRVTGVATDELTVGLVDRAASRARRLVDSTDDLADAGEALDAALDEMAEAASSTCPRCWPRRSRSCATPRGRWSPTSGGSRTRTKVRARWRRPRRARCSTPRSASPPTRRSTSPGSPTTGAGRTARRCASPR